jgi:hypothetical protein
VDHWPHVAVQIPALAAMIVWRRLRGLELEHVERKVWGRIGSKPRAWMSPSPQAIRLRGAHSVSSADAALLTRPGRPKHTLHEVTMIDLLIALPLLAAILYMHFSPRFAWVGSE